MSLKKNDEIKLNIESVTSEGSALGRYNGLAVFVFGAVPGDVVEAHIIKGFQKLCRWHNKGNNRKIAFQNRKRLPCFG